MSAVGVEAEALDADRQPAHTKSVSELVEDAAHLLPSQGPLHVFVHHNTLHAFEDLPFDRAVVTASRLFGTQPFQSEAAFAAHLRSGRIEVADLIAVVDETEPLPSAAVSVGVGARDLVVGRLQNLFEIPCATTLAWQLSEGRVLSRFHSDVPEERRRELNRQARSMFPGLVESAAEARLCRALWYGLIEAVEPATAASARSRRRPRDLLSSSAGIDTDRWVHPLLIRFCAGFLDQGISYWAMPYRELGMLDAFRRLYGMRGAPPDRWMKGLDAECRRQLRESWSAERTIEWALDLLEVAAEDVPDVLSETLLSLRGWAGMVRQLESNPDLAPVEARPVRLIDYLAVQLTLDAVALRAALAEEVPDGGTSGRGEASGVDLPLVYEAFVAAQMLPTTVQSLVDPAQARLWLGFVADLDSLERRRLLHLAYERRHRTQVLDGLIGNQSLLGVPPPRPEFQAVFCLDDREESVRRHLEETFPACETFGYAGFFGIDMVYEGLDDVRGRPLCPVSMTPGHLVVERAVASEEEYRASRQRVGRLRHSALVGSKSLVRGSLLTGVAGIAWVVPLIARCLFPRHAERWSHRLLDSAKRGPVTRLRVAKDESRPTAIRGELVEGYSADEMAAIVESLLRTVGIVNRASPLILVVGHGSSSLNNPHEAAHDCGATGGGRGGPNARAFAVMANQPEVRRRLAEAGISLPPGCWFVGAYHNTCDDSMTYYDEDLIPPEARPLLDRAQAALAQACARNAQERCRRFELSPRKQTAAQALVDAEAHAADLAQPRPEYGHATNAVCIVGRRARTRGLFLDRRAFLVSYDPVADESGDGLANLLAAVGPVCAGINLEYYFSFVDPTGYGCGTKLPHNIVGLLGVMDGHASDLRTGLPWQMVEIHEPVRLLLVVEAEPAMLERIMERDPEFGRLVRNQWIQLVSWSPEGTAMYLFAGGEFRAYRAETRSIPVLARSADFYTGRTEHLTSAHLQAAFARRR